MAHKKGASSTRNVRFAIAVGSMTNTAPKYIAVQPIGAISVDISDMHSVSLLTALASDNLPLCKASESGTCSGTHRNLAGAEPPFLAGTATYL